MFCREGLKVYHDVINGGGIQINCPIEFTCHVRCHGFWGGPCCALIGGLYRGHVGSGPNVPAEYTVLPALASYGSEP